MVNQRVRVSIIGQIIGLVVVGGIFMAMFNLTIVPAFLMGLVGLLIGGWIAESYFSDETVETRAAGG